MRLPLQHLHISVDSILCGLQADYARFCVGKKEQFVLKAIKVFLADDSEAVRQQLNRALSLIEGYTLVGTSGGNGKATEMIRELKPDVVVLDISMPHREGIRVLREIREEVPLAQIIIFTADPSVVLQEVCLEAGADYYLDKTQIQDLIDIMSIQSAN